MSKIVGYRKAYFLHHRYLLGKLCRAAYETVHEMMTAAAVGADGFRTGMVVVAQSAGDLLNPNPHLHAIVPRGGWDPEGIWVPVPYVDTEIAERVFRAKVLTFLKVEGLLSEERERMLLSWNHHTGFSVHYDVIVEPEDGDAVERLARYLVRPPVSLERMRWDQGADTVVYTRKAQGAQPGVEEHIDALDFLARVIAHIPEPRLHLVHYRQIEPVPGPTSRFVRRPKPSSGHPPCVEHSGLRKASAYPSLCREDGYGYPPQRSGQQFLRP